MASYWLVTSCSKVLKSAPGGTSVSTVWCIASVLYPTAFSFRRAVVAKLVNKPYSFYFFVADSNSFGSYTYLPRVLSQVKYEPNSGDSFIIASIYSLTSFKASFQASVCFIYPSKICSLSLRSSIALVIETYLLDTSCA
jgi:hypothetical protein